MSDLVEFIIVAAGLLVVGVSFYFLGFGIGRIAKRAGHKEDCIQERIEKDEE